MIYGVLDYSKKNEDMLALWPVITKDFSEYLQQAQAYAKKALKKPLADSVIRMLPSMENGNIRRIEIDDLIFRVTEEVEE